MVVGGRDAGLSSLRSLRVVLPSGEVYWTVVDHEYRVVAAADAFLRDLRFGADRTESTTKLYAGELAVEPGDLPNAVDGRAVAEGVVGAPLVVVAHPVWQGRPTRIA